MESREYGKKEKERITEITFQDVKALRLRLIQVIELVGDVVND